MSEPLVEADVPLSVYVDNMVIFLGAGEAPDGALACHQYACSDQADHPGVTTSAE